MISPRPHIWNCVALPGDLLSLLPLGGDAIGVTTEGLQYPLHDETLFLGQARGVSNVFTGSRAAITLRRGSVAGDPHRHGPVTRIGGVPWIEDTFG